MKIPSRHDILVSLAFVAVLATLVYAARWAWITYRTPKADVDFNMYPVRGLDLSAHNGDVDFDKVAASGISFVWMKASEGETIRSSFYADNYQKAVDAGLTVGAYHFFRFDCDGVMQAMNLCQALGQSRPALGVAIDVELENNAGDVSDQLIVSRLESMVDYLKMKGIPIIFYTNKEGYARFIKDYFSDYPLWICSFSDFAPFDNDTPWVFWQYSHAGEVDGINGKVDENVYNGSVDNFRQFVNETNHL